MSTSGLLGIFLLATSLFLANSAMAQEGDAPAESGTEERKVEAVPEKKETAKNDKEPAYEMRVKELEEKVNDLKEKIFRSKTRLTLLKETVLKKNIAGSQATIVFENKMGNSFKLEQLVFSLDGQQLTSLRDKDGDLADKESIELFNGAIVPGRHNLSAQLIYRGNGFGVFSYLRGYKFTIRSSQTFQAEEGKTTLLNVVGFEKGNFTTPLEERPGVKYELQFVDNEQQSAQSK